MKLALYHPWLKEKGGAEKVVLKYAKNSRHDVTVFTGFYNPEKTFEGFEEVEVVSLSDREPGGFVDRLIRFELFNSVRKLDLTEFDAFIVSTAGVGTSITLRNSDVSTYTYTHTPLRTVLPEFRESYLEDINPFFRPIYGAAIKFFGWLEEKSYGKVDHSFANSEPTKERIISRRLMHQDSIDVVHPGVDLDVEKGNYENYFLYPSRFRRYKRQHIALEAFKKADLEEFDLDLVLAGSGQEEEYVEELREEAGENVEILTDLPDDDWKNTFRNCYTVLFLAENEDWGIVPLEAGAYSKPVIAVNEGGPTESVLHEKTGFLVEPDAEKIAERMEELAGNLEKVREMGEHGRKNAENYSWKKFADRIDKVLEN